MNKTLNILLIEDISKDTLQILEDLYWGISKPFIERINTAEALQNLLLSHHWDVIIAAYCVRYLDIFTALTLVQQNQIEIPFIVISDIIDVRAAVNLIKAGAQDYLPRNQLSCLPEMVKHELQEAQIRTAQKQSKQTPWEIEAKYSDVCNYAVEGIYQSTLSGQYLMANISLAKMYGYASPTELITELKNIEKQLYVAPNRRNEFKALLTQQRSISGFESQIYCKDGSIKWISESARIVHDAQGRPTYYEGFVSDISNRKCMEADLELSKTRTNEAFQQAPIGFTETDPITKKITYANPWFCKMTGYTQAELREMAFEDISHPEDADLSRQLSHQLSSGRLNRFSHENRYRCKDGTYFWAETTICVVYLEEKQDTYHLAIIHSINDRKEAELTLQASERRFTDLVAAVPVGIFRQNLARENIYVNDRLCEICGLFREEALGDRWLQGLHPDDHDWVLAELERSTQEKRPFQLEYRFQRPDHDVIWLYGQAIPELDAEGQIISYIGSVTDISERKRAETVLKDLISGIATTTEADFFPELASHIAAALKVSHVLVTEKSGNSLSTLAFLANGILQPTHTYPLANTPCEQVITKGKFYCDYCVQEQFPHFLKLASIEAQSYFGSALYDHKGLVTGHICILSDDPFQDLRQAEYLLHVFAARAAAELERQKATTKLERLNHDLETEIEERTKALAMTQIAVDWAADCVFIIRADGRFYYANDAACDKLGYQEEELIRRSVFDIDPTITPEHWPMLWEAIKQQPILTSESQHRSKTGQIYPVEINSRYFEFDGEEYSIAFARDISERKIAEALIRQENAFRQQIIENMVEGLCVCHQLEEFPFINFTLWNRQMQVITGYTQEEINHFGWVDCFMPYADPYEYVSTHVARLQQGEQLIAKEKEIQRKDGQHRTISLSSSILPSNSKDLTILILLQDITDRKQNEASARLLSAVVESTDDAIFTTNLDGIITSWNSGAVSLFGYSEAEAIKKPLLMLSPPDLKHEGLQILECLKREERVDHFETIRVPKEGDPLDVSVTISPMKDESGLLVGASSIVRNMTERRKSEQENARLKERLQFLLASSPAVIFSCRTDGDFSTTFISENIQAIVGYSPAEFLEHSNFWIDHIHPEDVSRTIEKLTALRKQHNNEHEYRFRHQDGHYIWLRNELRLVCDPLGRQNEIVGYFIDISDRKHAEIQLHQTNQELARATRLKDEFLANMSHEFRTPLNAILGMTEGLQEQVFGEINERQAKALKNVGWSSNHLLSLINDILDVAKIEAGQLDLHLTTTNVKALCESSLTFIKQKAHKKQIKIETPFLSEHTHEIHLDERRIRQVLINLLNNAVKFTEPGGCIKLESHIQKNDKDSINSDNKHHIQLMISVTDTGIGIPKDRLDDLFKPFVQLDSTLQRKYEGTGLGLALVKQIVELHGGQVLVSSELGVGTCFSFSLPYRSCPLPTQGAPKVQQNETHQATVTKGLRVLLVEDNEANIRTTTSYLKAKGYRIDIAKTGLEAVSKAKSCAPEMILMDIQMPIMNGFEAIEKIRLDPHCLNIPIIALTAFAMKGDKEKCLSAGADAYLSKPVQLKEMVTKIEQLLVSKKANQTPIKI